MIPIGAIYSDIRRDLLTFFPEGSKATAGSGQTFSEWFNQKNAPVTILSASANDIRFWCTPSDLASSFLGEIEYLTDQCIEHQCEMISFLRDGVNRSDAWHVVTVYYYAFFAAQALLRLIGKPSIFLDKDTVSNLLRTIGPVKSPGAGVFVLSGPHHPTVSGAEFHLHKKKMRPHEAVWNTLLQYFESLVILHKDDTSAGELEFYRSICTKELFRSYKSYDWPSGVRYKANYNPGFAYNMVRGNSFVKIRSILQRGNTAPSGELFTNLRGSIQSVDVSLERYSEHVQLLHDFGHCILVLARELYSDLCSRRTLDTRWEDTRVRFLKRHFIPGDKYPFMSEKHNT